MPGIANDLTPAFLAASQSYRTGTIYFIDPGCGKSNQSVFMSNPLLMVPVCHFSPQHLQQYIVNTQFKNALKEGKRLRNF
jgi:hypothetical protein